MDDQEKEKMREASKRLYAQLQETEKKHQEEREKLLVSFQDVHTKHSLLVKVNVSCAAAVADVHSRQLGRIQVQEEQCVQG